MLKALSVLTISATLAGCVAVPVDDVYGAPITYVHTAPSVVYVPRPVYIPRSYYRPRAYYRRGFYY